MGKNTKIMVGLPVFQQDPTYQGRINVRMAELKEERNWTASNLALQYQQLRLEKKEIKEDLSKKDFELESISQMLIEKYEEEDTSSIKLKDGGTVRVQPEPYSTVAEKESFRVWCIENGYERELRLMPQTVNAVVKEHLQKGDPEPPGVKVYIKNKIILGKAV